MNLASGTDSAPPHHSQGNAVVERAIESLEEKISLITQEKTIDWEQAVPLAVLSINTRRNKSTARSPYELMFNRGHHITSRSLVKYAEPALSPDAIEEMRADTIGVGAEAHHSAKVRYNRRHRPTVFDIGDLVMSKLSSRRSKLANRYEGPCRILSRDKDIYRIQNLSTNRILTRHVSHLEKFIAVEDESSTTSSDELFLDSP